MLDDSSIEGTGPGCRKDLIYLIGHITAARWSQKKTSKKSNHTVIIATLLPIHVSFPYVVEGITRELN